MFPEVRIQIVEAFVTTEAAAVVAKRVGVGRDRVYRVWKEDFGEEGVRERGNRLRGLASSSMGNSADLEVKKKAVAAFSTAEPMKKTALRLGVHYTQVRKWWGAAFGDDQVVVRARRLQVERTRENNQKRAGEPREVSIVEILCEACGTSMKVSAISVGKRVKFVCAACKILERGADTPCPVCGLLWVGVRGLSAHFAHANDNAHHAWCEQRQGDVLGSEGVGHVVCVECGHKAKNLWKHLETAHGTSPSAYVAKWPEARWRVALVEQTRLKRSLKTRAETNFMKGARKDVLCPTCGQTHEMSLFAGSLHDFRCEDCKAEDDLVLWRGKTEPEDFVSCRKCGHRAENLTSHLRSAHAGFDYLSQHSDAQITALNSGQRASWSPYQISREVLLGFADESDHVVVASVCRAFGCAPATVVRWCRAQGLRTKNRMGWQKAVLDLAQSVLGEKYEWEWSDGRVRSPDTNHVFYFDGYFPACNLIIEAHGEQHFYFIESWHKVYEEFERLQEVDRFKIERARALGYEVKIVRYSDPIHDKSFWASLLGGDKALWSNKSDEDKMKDVGEVLGELRKGGFPTILPSSNTKAEFTKLCAQKVGLDEEMFVRPYTSRGTIACASFFSNRYNARYRTASSVREAWDDDGKLRAAIRVQFNAGHPTTAPRVLRALQMICRTPSVFRPGVAKFVCETYCVPGGVVWDPCAGYGGRLFGAMAAGVGRYLATDVEPETVEGNRRLAADLGCAARCEVVCGRAEKFDPDCSLDLVFTSPPYFDLEIYGKASQAAMVQDSIQAWVREFLEPVMQTARRCLRVGGHLVLNLPSKPLDGVVLADEATRIASHLGFEVRTPVFMPVRRLRSGLIRADPLVIFRQRP